MPNTSRKTTPSHPSERARPAHAPLNEVPFCAVSAPENRSASAYRFVRSDDDPEQPLSAVEPKVVPRSPSSAPSRPRVVDSGSYAHVGADGEPLITEHLGPPAKSPSDRPRTRSVPPTAPSSRSSRPPKPLPRSDD